MGPQVQGLLGNGPCLTTGRWVTEQSWLAVNMSPHLCVCPGLTVDV